MADIVSSLFGLSTNDIQQKRNEEFKAFQTSMVNQARGSRAKVGASFGAGLGAGLGKAAAGWLGIQDPELERAATIEKVLKDTQDQLGDGVQDPATLYPTLQKNLNDAGFTREAMQLGEVSQKAIQQKQLNEASIQEKQANAQTKAFELQAKQGEAETVKQYQTELATLDPESPTYQQDAMKVALKYAPPEKVYSTLQTSQDKEAYRVWASKLQDDAQQAKIEAAIARGASAQELAILKGSIDKEKVILKAKIAPEAGDKPLSGREARYADVVGIAGNEAIGSILNIVNLPSAVTGGFWGSGLAKMQAGTGMLDAPVGALKNELTPEAVQRYNAEIRNIGKNFSRLVNGGLQASQADMDSFENQFRIQEGDKPLTALTKLAQMRQTFERAAEVKEVSAATPKEQLELWKLWRKQVEEAIPITVNDVNNIANSKDKSKTFAQALQEAQKAGEVTFRPAKGWEPRSQKDIDEIEKAMKVVSMGRLSKAKAKSILIRQGIKVE